MANLRRYYIPWAVIFFFFAAFTIAGVITIHAKITPRTATTASQAAA